MSISDEADLDCRELWSWREQVLLRRLARQAAASVLFEVLSDALRRDGELLEQVRSAVGGDVADAHVLGAFDQARDELTFGMGRAQADLRELLGGGAA